MIELLQHFYAYWFLPSPENGYPKASFVVYWLWPWLIVIPWYVFTWARRLLKKRRVP